MVLFGKRKNARSCIKYEMYKDRITDIASGAKGKKEECSNKPLQSHAEMEICIYKVNEAKDEGW